MSNSTDRAWDIIEKVGICMLTTRTSSRDFHARPVEGRLERDEGCIYVVTDLRSAKEHELERDPPFWSYIRRPAIERLSRARRLRHDHYRAGDGEGILVLDGQYVVEGDPTIRMYVFFAPN